MSQELLELKKYLEYKWNVCDEEDLIELWNRMEFEEEQTNYKLKLRNLIENNLGRIKSVCLFEQNRLEVRRKVRLEVMKIIGDFDSCLAVKCDGRNNAIGIVENNELMFEIFDIVENETLLTVILGPCWVTLK